jgi:hypothetical protein
LTCADPFNAATTPTIRQSVFVPVNVTAAGDVVPLFVP